MNIKEYRKTTSAKLAGRRVSVRRELRNGYITIPAGAVMTIQSKGAGGVGGLNLEGPACEHCGIAPHINRVPCTDIELLEENPCPQSGSP